MGVDEEKNLSEIEEVINRKRKKKKKKMRSTGVLVKGGIHYFFHT